MNRIGLSGAVAVGDAAVVAAMRLAFEHLKLVLEPSGALGLAALLEGGVPLGAGAESVGVVACGGNISCDEFIKLVSASAPP